MVAQFETAINEARPVTGETVSGEVEKIIFASEETGYVIFTIPFEENRRKTSLAVLGHFPGLQEGSHISADGKFTYDPKRGKQFKAELIRFTPPSSAHGIERYLCSGMIKGIGPVLAKRITERFGDKTLEVMEKESARLREVDGVGAEKLASIRASWREHTSMRDLMVFLQQYGISSTKAGKIVKKYGDEAITRISEDPYCLCRDIDGIGFLTADKAALKLDIPRHAFKRCGAGVIHVLEDAKAEGHCGLPPAVVIERATKLLGVDEKVAVDALDTLVLDLQLLKDTIAGRDLIYLPYMRAYERTIAALLRRFTDMGESRFAGGASEQMITDAEKEIGKTLAPAQRAAVTQSLRHRVSVITGGPGSGKSTLLGALRQIFKTMKATVVLAAPTGRAAKRMSETTGLEAKTIHRLLVFDPQSGEFLHNAKRPLAGDVFIVDEASMLDVPLAFKLLRAIPKEAQVIFVGDKDQLPSVGPGSFLADMIHSQAVPTTFLREIFRQAASSKIITNAHAVNAGSMPEDGSPGDDFFFVRQTDPDAIKAMMRKILTERIPQVFKLDPRRASARADAQGPARDQRAEQLLSGHPQSAPRRAHLRPQRPPVPGGGQGAPAPQQLRPRCLQRRHGLHHGHQSEGEVRGHFVRW
jgi:exodeoxyribonuclease V alpha subunit